MRRTAATAVLTLALAGGFAAGFAGPAVAGTYTHQDPAKDVTLTGPFNVSTVPANKEADITKVSVTHSATSVRSVTTLRDITKNDLHRFITTLRLKNGSKFKTFQAVLATDDGNPQSDLTLYTGAGDPVSCPGLSSTVDFQKDVATITVPRSCIGKPAWVKAAVVAEWIPNHDDYYFDNGLTKGGTEETVKYSSQIKKA